MQIRFWPKKTTSCFFLVRVGCGCCCWSFGLLFFVFGTQEGSLFVCCCCLGLFFFFLKSQQSLLFVKKWVIVVVRLVVGFCFLFFFQNGHGRG